MSDHDRDISSWVFSRWRLIAILAVGGVLAVWGIWTVRPTVMIPDEAGAIERTLRMGMNRDPFINNFYKGGNLHLYLLAFGFFLYYVYLIVTGKIDRVMAGASKVSETVGKAGTNPWAGSDQFVSALYDFLVLGRLLSVIAAVATIYIVYRIGCRLYDRRAGEFAGATLAVSMVFINSAHFSTEDATVTALIAATLLFVVRYRDNHRRHDLAIAALMSGLAVSAKATAGTLLFPLALVFGHRIFRDLGLELNTLDAARRTLRELSLYVAVATVGYVLTTPSMLIYPGTWFNDIIFEMANRNISSNSGELGWITQAGNLLNGLGFPLFVLTLAGVGFVLWQFWRNKRLDILPAYPLVFVVVTFAIIGTWDSTAIWYIVPMVPLFAVFSGGFLSYTLSKQRFRKPVAVVVAMVFLFSLIYTGAAMHQFETDSRVKASSWIESNMESNATVDVYTTHHYLPGFPDDSRISRHPIFLEKNIDNLDTATDRISCGAPDYVVLSQFHYRRYIQHPDAYPRATEFFTDLLEEKNGYTTVAEFGPQIDPQSSTETAIRNSMTPQVYAANPRIVILERSKSSTCTDP